MRKIFIILILFVCLICYSQNIANYDTIIDMKYYKAYYNKDIQTSSFVIYKIYQGGGDISRANLNFKSYERLPHFNYEKTGYDRGHLVPAEDFANDKGKLKSTFYYINCVPQTIKLNRGIWKIYEAEVRKFSQSDSLLIVCGGCDYNGLIPSNCFKIVYSLTTHKCIYSLLFYNDNSGYVVVNNKLKRKLSYKKSKELYENRNVKKNN